MPIPPPPKNVLSKYTSKIGQSRGLFNFIISDDFINRVIAANPKQNGLLIALGFQKLRERISAQTVVLPSLSISTLVPTIINNGPKRNTGYVVEGGGDAVETKFEFIGSNPQDAACVYYALRAWVQYIHGPLNDVYGLSIRSESTPFGTAYYDDYVVDAEANIYAYENDEVGIQAKFFEMFPARVSDVKTEWSQGEQQLSVDVRFHLYYYQIYAPDSDGIVLEMSVLDKLQNLFNPPQVSFGANPIPLL